MIQSPPALPLVLIGAGGHARVLLALAAAAGRQIIGVCDPDLASRRTASWHNIPVLGADDALSKLQVGEVALANGIGQLVGSTTRRDVYNRCRAMGFSFPWLVHPAAWVAPDATLDDGAQVMAGAIVQPGSSIGQNSVVNTRASVDHDCIVGDHVHIAPGATLCGTVTVGAGAFIGAGAVVLQGRRVGAGAVVAGGVTAARDVTAGSILMPKRDLAPA